jgi:Protein of unknown function (DUF3568)
MKKGIFAAIIVVAVGVTGCVSTVNDSKTAGLKLSTDKVENRYDRPLPDVYQASIRALKASGYLSRESTLLGTTNQVKTLEGTVSDVPVWVRVEAIEPQITEVVVQARTTWGGSQVAIASQLATRIALELAK